ncbi:MAG: L-fucose/L-arabinose isomerase family protein [Caldilineales bacterium]
MKQFTLGVIFGNRDFFPDQLITEARSDIATLFAEMDIRGIWLAEHESKLGSVETYADARRCADLFQADRRDIDGILVCLPNFGDEKAVADTLKIAGLNVPVLVQAYPDDLDAFNVERRRDAFCGKISVCNNLRQYGFSYSLTEVHTSHPLSPEFRQDLRNFMGVCRVVNGLRNARLGAVGARPNAFNTTRYSEKLLQSVGMSVQTVDLSELLGVANRLKDDDAKVKERLEAIFAYLPSGGVPSPSILRMAKFGVALSGWMEALDIHATALQCWNSIQKNYGINVCTLMSMMSEALMPSACEVDITGVASMYALQLATGQSAALVDWNNNYAGDPNKCVLFHCGNFAKSFYKEAHMAYADILATTLGQENTYGAIAGRVSAGPMSFARISTDDVNGCISAYCGDGTFTDDTLDTFGSRAVVEVPDLQGLLKYICRNGFEHHTAMAAASSADILAEAFETYFDWDVYQH